VEDRHLRWRAVLRFRRRARLAGLTRRGEPIVVVAGATLVWSHDTAPPCFRHLAHCARCGEAVASPAHQVKRLADLHRPEPAVICRQCSRPPVTPRWSTDPPRRNT